MTAPGGIAVIPIASPPPLLGAQPDVRLLATLVDLLLPGDDVFPAASTVGAHGLVAERLRDRLGPDALDRLADAIAVAAGGSALTDLPPLARVAAVRKLEAGDPDLFTLLRTTLYYSYYQSPAVVLAVRAVGWTYNDAPQPAGYPLPPFDPTPGINLPATPRGFYKPTAEITRLPPTPVSAAPEPIPTTPSHGDPLPATEAAARAGIHPTEES